MNVENVDDWLSDSEQLVDLLSKNKWNDFFEHAKYLH